MSNYHQRTEGDITYLFPLTVGYTLLCAFIGLPIVWGLWAALIHFFAPAALAIIETLLSFIEMVGEAIDKKTKQ